jgi:signal transduction histidine kinase/ligand-binding sensor domain-containing protein
MFIAGFAAGAAQTTAGEPAFVVREWHREEGLPSEVISDVTQTRDGYLWLATPAGLVRFDGREFKVFVVLESLYPNRPALMAVSENDRGLWVVTRSGESMHFRDGVFTADPLPKPYAGASTAEAFLAPDESRWVALRDRAILRFSGNGFQVFDARHGIKPDHAARFAVDGRGQVWISSGDFLGRYENGTLVPVDAGTTGSELRVISSRVGGPWVVTAEKVLKLDADNRPQTFATLPRLLGAHYVTAACEDRTGALWLGTRSQGVHRFKDQKVVHVPTSNERVNALIEDCEGNIWVGTQGGLNSIGPKIHQLYDKTAGLLENSNYSLCETRDGSVWSANGDGGIVRFNRDEVTVPIQHPQWPRFGVLAIASNPAGGLWFAGSPGLFQLPADLSQLPIAVGPPSITGVRRMFSDSHGNLWLSIDRGRLARWSVDKKYIILGEENGLVGGEVRSFAEDKNGVVWIGTSQGRLLRWADDRFSAATPSPPTDIGAINMIHFEAGNVLWLATALRGIAILQPGGPRILDAQNGLPENSITQIVADDHGFVWCGSDTALFRLSRSEIQRYAANEIPAVNPVILGRDEGLKGITCSGIYFPGAIKTRDGHIWFATRQGVLAIDPSASLLNSSPRRVRIEEILAGSQRLPTAPAVVISSDVRKFQIKFSILCLSAPRRVHAEFRLDGFDSDWISAGGSNVASYPRLRPGVYTFQVRAGIGGTEQNQVTDTVKIEVQAPWWQAAWFVAAAVVVVVLAIGATVRVWSTRRLRRRLRELEREHAVERERTRIAQNIHDDVGAGLTHISLLTQSALVDNAPEKLNRIYEATREITRSLDEIVWAANPTHDTLESFAEYLASNAQRFLHAANIRCRLDFPVQLPSQTVPSQVRHHLFLCCREAINNVVKHAHATSVLIQLSVRPVELTVVIADDGRGFQATGKPDPARTNSGNGLHNMQQRMTELGGTCAITAGPEGRGTTVTLSAPIS